VPASPLTRQQATRGTEAPLAGMLLHCTWPNTVCSHTSARKTALTEVCYELNGVEKKRLAKNTLLSIKRLYILSHIENYKKLLHKDTQGKVSGRLKLQTRHP